MLVPSVGSHPDLALPKSDQVAMRKVQFVVEQPVIDRKTQTVELAKYQVEKKGPEASGGPEGGEKLGRLGAKERDRTSTHARTGPDATRSKDENGAGDHVEPSGVSA
jgi:hypothetical protein